MNMKKYAVFVQTDKSVYKPSDNIKFRVMVLDAETKPYNFESIDIFITDGGDNRIKQYDDVAKNFKKGVYQNELQLSDLPVMGTWKIHVKVNGEQDIEKSFDVEEYVLPKFEVSIDTVPNVPFKDGVIKATVNTKYTFGKIAKGKATVIAEVHTEVESPYRKFHIRFIEPTKKVSKTVDVDGKKFVEFSLKDDLNIRDGKNEHTVKLHASFKDRLSGKKATADTYVKIHKDAIKMELKKSAEKFKPGLQFTVTAILTSHAKSTPIVDTINPVKFKVISYDNTLRKIKANHIVNICGLKIYPSECWEENFIEKEYTVKLENGIAKIDIDVPKETKYFSVKVRIS
jgi:CD109 antigen